MKPPLTVARPLTILDSVISTQDEAAKALLRGDFIGGVLGRDQVGGRGRLQREWFSKPGESLTVSFIFPDYANHPKPYLVGMAFAIAAAGVLYAKVQWPNDIVVGRKKLGGILTELYPDKDGNKIPVVGIGVNLLQEKWPAEIEQRAISLKQTHAAVPTPETLAHMISDRCALVPEPTSWLALNDAWMELDETPGKKYQLPSGEEATAIAIGSEGQLIASVAGESTSVFAGTALFGDAR